MLRRWWRGITSALGVLTIPLGPLACRGVQRFLSPERLDRGLVILLPGIQGKSHVEASIAKGLGDAGLDLAIEVHDWTTGCWPLFLYHLRGLQRNRRAAARLAATISAYCQQYPDRPVHVIGHSGGAGVALLALEAMPDGEQVTSLILLAAAVSPSYDLEPALEHVETGIWNFSSKFDAIFVGAGTLVCGTIDGRHVWSAGARGFDAGPAPDRLHEQPYSARMLLSWNFGGHFGCTNRVFVSEWIAPLLRSA